ncbi:MAG: hypothetical protein MR654_05720 [Corynebacterium glucuronolyticum]|nr:hypothetical protein [Corynebacterium glucuronolyticum]
MALALVWLRAGDPLAQTLQQADDGPVAVNLAEVYGIMRRRLRCNAPTKATRRADSSGGCSG